MTGADEHDESAVNVDRRRGGDRRGTDRPRGRRRLSDAPSEHITLRCPIEIIDLITRFAIERRINFSEAQRELITTGYVAAHSVTRKSENG